MSNKIFDKPNYKTTEDIDPLLYTGVKWQDEVCNKFDNKTGKCIKSKLDTLLKKKYKDDGLFVAGDDFKEIKNMLKYSNYTKALCNYEKDNNKINLYGKLPYYNNDEQTIDSLLNTTNKNIKSIKKFINEDDFDKEDIIENKISPNKCKKFYGAYCEILKGNLKELLGNNYTNDALQQYEPNCACYGDLLKDVSPSDYNMLIKNDKTGQLKTVLNNRTCSLTNCNNNKYTPSQAYNECNANAITICTNNVNIGGIDVSDGAELGQLAITNDCSASSSVSNNNVNNENQNDNNNDNENNNDNKEKNT